MHAEIVGSLKLFQVRLTDGKTAKWRVPFGKGNVLSDTSSMQHPTYSRAPPSVLRTALRVVNAKYHLTDKNLIRNALRIVANCCADSS